MMCVNLTNPDITCLYSFGKLRYIHTYYVSLVVVDTVFVHPIIYICMRCTNLFHDRSFQVCCETLNFSIKHWLMERLPVLLELTHTITATYMYASYVHVHVWW